MRHYKKDRSIFKNGLLIGLYIVMEICTMYVWNLPEVQKWSSIDVKTLIVMMLIYNLGRVAYHINRHVMLVTAMKRYQTYWYEKVGVQFTGKWKGDDMRWR